MNFPQIKSPNHMKLVWCSKDKIMPCVTPKNWLLFLKIIVSVTKRQTFNLFDILLLHKLIAEVSKTDFWLPDLGWCCWIHSHTGSLEKNNTFSFVVLFYSQRHFFPTFLPDADAFKILNTKLTGSVCGFGARRNIL